MVVNVAEERPLATGESSAQKDPDLATRSGFFYTYCGGNPVTALITPALTIGAALVVVLGFAAYVGRFALESC